MLKFGSFLILALALSFTGCSPSPGQVSGKVTYKGKPVPGGWVTIRPSDPKQNTLSAQIDREGNYSMEIPAGEVKLAIDNREFEPLPKAGAGIPSGIALPADVVKKLGGQPQPQPTEPVDPSTTADAPVVRETDRYIKIPDKYYLVETSGLSYTVKSGKQQHDISLE